MQVIYAGILVSSGGFDLTMWLLFAFVVNLNVLFTTKLLLFYSVLLLGICCKDLTFTFLLQVVNLAFAAAETHEWYHHKFDNYPSSRRAIFPLIF